MHAAADLVKTIEACQLIDVQVVKLEDATVEGVAKVYNEAGWVSDPGCECYA